MSWYRTAIDQTIAVVNQRSRNFRNQVLAVVALAVTSVAAALALRGLWPLTGLVAIVPLSGLFLWLDTKKVGDWRSSILQMWARRDIELVAFEQAVRADPGLPEMTLDGMLNLLGTSQSGTVDLSPSVQTRGAVAAVVGFADVLNLRQFAVKVCATAIVSICIGWAAFAHAWSPLAIATPVLPAAVDPAMAQDVAAAPVKSRRRSCTAAARL